MLIDEKYFGYLFVAFTDGREDGEQVYFAISRDGLNFEDVNAGNPVLISDIGDKGARDPFIIRDVHDDSHFYLVATDLRIANGNGWDAAQYNGSRAMLVWETNDLCKWGEPRLVEVGLPKAGCVWAPEVIYDDKREAYMVIFASMVKQDTELPKQRIYASYTKDFWGFSAPFVYMEKDKHVIDMTIIRDCDMYYRFSKDETDKKIIMERGRELMGDFEVVESKSLSELVNVEGPQCYYLADRQSWCLIVDRFATGEGYMPLLCNDLTKGDFVKLPVDSYNLGKIRKRHGGVIPITKSEFEQLKNM